MIFIAFNCRAEFLKYVLESNVDEIGASCPFLIERAVVAVISAVIHLMKDPVEAGWSSSRVDSTTSSVSPCGQTSSASLWASLSLLREVPHEVMANIGDRLGAGLVTFIRSAK